MNKNTLIILPGWGGSHETWADFVALAKPHFQDVIVIDLPCFGDEPCPTEVWGVEEYSSFVREKLVEFEGKKVILLGHSFGGAVATHLVANNPELVDKLILSGAAVYRPNNYLKRGVFGILAKLGTLVVSLVPSKTMQTKLKKILYRVASSPDYDKTDGIQRDIFKKIIRQDMGQELTKIQVPTRIVHGTHDRYVPMSSGRKIAKNIVDVSLVEVSNGTHGLHIHKKKELLDAIVSYA